MDVFLGFAPWRSPEALPRWKTAVEAGWIRLPDPFVEVTALDWES
jgi:hypothetical protein